MKTWEEERGGEFEHFGIDASMDGQSEHTSFRQQWDMC